jgi:hypothetical protein
MSSASLSAIFICSGVTTSSTGISMVTDSDLRTG